MSKFTRDAVGSVLVEEAHHLKAAGNRDSSPITDHDEHILRTTPGLYPDPLYPLDEEGKLNVLPEQWHHYGLIKPKL